MNVAVAIAADRLPGVRVDLDRVIPETGDLNRLLARVDEVILAGSMSERTEAVIRRETSGLGAREARALAVGLGLGGPEFQVQ
jgi:hypothetical protein